jgi:hypothetical protein
MNLTLFLIALFFGILVARASAVFARGGIQPTNPVVILINFASIPSTFSIIIFGFLSLPWWIPIVSFICISLVVGALINHSTMAFSIKQYLLLA